MRRLSNLILSLLFTLALTCGAFAQNKLTSVTTATTNGGIDINIRGLNLAEPEQSYVANHKTLILTFNNTILRAATHRLSINKEGIKSIGVVQYKSRPAITRVTINFAAPNQNSTKIATITDGWCISIAANMPINNSELFINRPLGLLIETKETKSTEQARPGIDFPNTVPPLQNIHALSIPTPKPISLNFVGTDIMFILKALAEQTGENIVTAPDVRGPLTVSLKNVSVEQALDLITKLGGYRYAKLNGTWVVGTGDFLTRVLVGGTGESPLAKSSTMKVVPLASRKAGEIKRTIVKTLSLDQLNESLRIVHPFSSGNDAEGFPSTNSTQGTNPAAPPSGGAPVTGANALEGDADYLILVGDKFKVEQASLLVQQLDAALANMAGVGGSTGSNGFAPVTVPYQVHGGKAEDLAKAVASIAGGVSVVATPNASRAGQTIVLHGRPADVSKLMAVIEQIDSVSASGELTFVVYEVKYADPRSLRDQVASQFETLSVVTGPQGVAGRNYRAPAAGAGGTPLSATTGGSGGTTAPSGGTGSTTSAGTTATSGMLNAASVFSSMEADAVPMRLVLSGSKSVIDRALDLLSQIDKPSPQVAIEARVVEMSKDDLIKAGFDWNIMTGGALSMIRLNNSQSGASNTANLWISHQGRTANLAGSLDRIIDKNNIISRPNVVAMDGREAVVFIGDVVRYIKNLTSSQNGPSVEIGEEEVGVKLNVLPHVGVDNTITMEVQPTVSFIRSFLPTGNGGQVPTTSVRTVRNTMRIADGETFAIGGLITDEDRRSVQGFPILMDLPLVGQLFRKTTNSKVKVEIMIFITARVIPIPSANGPNPAGEQTKKGG